MAAFNGTTYEKGTIVLVTWGANEGLAGEIVAAGIEPTTREPNGTYLVRILLDGEVVSLHHSQLEVEG